jgi:2-iminobutanoate/2-iminopropanoate deaminase
MTSSFRSDADRLAHGPVFSWSRIHGDLIFTSGHAAVDVDSLELTPGDLSAEARLALENLRRTLRAAGSSLERVLKVTVYLTDIGEYAAFNRVYREFFAGAQAPARSCVEVRRLPFNFKVEIEAIAARCP